MRVGIASPHMERVIGAYLNECLLKEAYDAIEDSPIFEQSVIEDLNVLIGCCLGKVDVFDLDLEESDYSFLEKLNESLTLTMRETQWRRMVPAMQFTVSLVNVKGFLLVEFQQENYGYHRSIASIINCLF